jgi:hypothetical protein
MLAAAYAFASPPVHEGGGGPTRTLEKPSIGLREYTRDAPPNRIIQASHEFGRFPQPFIRQFPDPNNAANAFIDAFSQPPKSDEKVISTQDTRAGPSARNPVSRVGYIVITCPPALGYGLGSQGAFRPILTIAPQITCNNPNR